MEKELKQESDYSDTELSWQEVSAIVRERCKQDYLEKYPNATSEELREFLDFRKETRLRSQIKFKKK